MLLQFSVKQITEHPSFIYNKDYQYNRNAEQLQNLSIIYREYCQKSFDEQFM
jgi:hypothetical protein